MFFGIICYFKRKWGFTWKSGFYLLLKNPELAISGLMLAHSRTIWAWLVASLFQQFIHHKSTCFPHICYLCVPYRHLTLCSLPQNLVLRLNYESKMLVCDVLLFCFPPYFKKIFWHRLTQSCLDMKLLQQTCLNFRFSTLF